MDENTCNDKDSDQEESPEDLASVRQTLHVHPPIM